MGLTDDQQIRKTLIEQVNRLVREKIATKEADLIQIFVKQYYGTVSIEDLQSRSILDLYGAAVSLWYYLYKRKQDTVKVRVYNPQLEQHGWQSTHTIVEISCEDKPFFIDSVRMALGRLGSKIHLMLYTSGIEFSRDQSGNIKSVGVCKKNRCHEELSEILLHMEIDRQSEQSVLDNFKQEILLVLEQLEIVVSDFEKMKANMQAGFAALSKCAALKAQPDFQESLNLLEWLADEHFTFLGSESYDLVQQGQKKVLKVRENTSLGILTVADYKNKHSGN